MLLLDTRTALWVLDDAPRLGPCAREMILGATAVHVSAASVWELTAKAMLGSLTVPDGFALRLADQGLALLSVSAQHAEGLRAFPELVRHDPFDRLIVAQAAIEGLQLLTADRVLLGLRRDFITDATA